jgi:hypothetical protein
MPLLPDEVSPDIRAHYIDLGRQFGCEDTLAQAQQTLLAFERFGDQVAAHGFIDEDASRLREAASLLSKEAQTALVGPSCCKRTYRGYVHAIRLGKDARQRARSILYIIAQRLAHRDDPIAFEAARAVSMTLQQTESSRGDPMRLAAQLDQLRASLSIPRVDREAQRRGGPEAASMLLSAAGRLRAIASANEPDAAPPSTRQTATADLLCGIIVELVRDARRAARSATRAQDDPTIAAAFALNRLYGTGATSGAESERSPIIG